jgi:hypothetical protein
MIKFAKCHPDKPIEGRDLCKNCYDKWLKKNNPDYKERQLLNRRNWYQKHKEKVRETERLRNAERQKDPSYRKRRRNYHLKKKYNIDEIKYEEMFKEQHGKCALCLKTPFDSKKLHVDHCHETGIVRGLLRARCNWYLGVIDQDPSLVDRLIVYRQITKENV